jgi:hypothetical protein
LIQLGTPILKEFSPTHKFFIQATVAPFTAA